MVISLLAAVAVVGWAIAAASYASDIDELHRPDRPTGRGRGAALAWLVDAVVRLVWNSVVQIPSAHRVVAHTFKEHPVLLGFIVLFAAGAGLFGWCMSRLERQFAKEDERFHRAADDN